MQMEYTEDGYKRIVAITEKARPDPYRTCLCRRACVKLNE